MIAFVLWLYGLIVVSSLIMVVAWGDAAQALAREMGLRPLDLIWCKPFVIAAGLTLHAICMAAASGYRAYDIMWNALPVMGSEAAVQIVVLSGLGLSKIMFVWAGSIEESPRRTRATWWAFVYLVILWGLFCWSWAIGAI